MHLLSLFIIKVFSFLPLKVRILIGRFGGKIASLFYKRDAHLIKFQSKIFLEKEISPSKVFASLGQTFLEAFNLNSIKMENIIVSDDAETIVQEMISQKDPQILLTGHIGNWELLASYLIRRGVKMATAAKTIRVKLGQEIISKIRKDYGIRTILRGGNSGAREIIDSIIEKHLTTSLIDQHTNVTSLESTFFNFPVKVPCSFVKIAKKHNAKIFVAFMIREDIYHYHLCAQEIDSSQSISDIIKEFNKILEKYIRLYPEQWVWFHKRWRYVNQKDLSNKEYLSYLKKLLMEQEKNVH